MWDKIVILFHLIHPGQVTPVITREQALEIAKKECERRHWTWCEDKVWIHQVGKYWGVYPMGRPMPDHALVTLVIDVLDGTIVRTTYTNH